MPLSAALSIPALLVPISLELDTDSRIVHARLWGTMQAAELHDHLEAIRDLVESGTIDLAWAGLYETEESTSVDTISADDVRGLGSLRAWPEGCYRAVIATSQEIFGLVRMYQLSNEQVAQRLRVVRTKEEALKWIAQRDTVAL